MMNSQSIFRGSGLVPGFLATIDRLFRSITHVLGPLIK
jgi:hypothetical protein